MALIQLKTNLKSLKYGDAADQPGGGNSGQPYIQTGIDGITGIKDVDRVLSPIVNLDDGLVRGGTVRAGFASLVDTARIGKFLTDLPRGPLFITKQVGLQLSNPKAETLKQTGKLFGNSGQPTRIYNLGFNTLAQIPVNAFGYHFVRHGLSPKFPGEDKEGYGYIAAENNKEPDEYNRLVLLKNKLFSAGPLFNTNTKGIIDEYIAGPDSIYGIGKTTIYRATVLNPGESPFTKYYDFSTVKSNVSPVKYSKNIGVSKTYFTAEENESINNIIALNFSSEPLPSQLNQTAVTYSVDNSLSNASTKYNELKAQVDALKSKEHYRIYGPLVEGALNGIPTPKNASVSNFKEPLTYKNSYGKKITFAKSFNSWNKISRETRIGSDRQDSINLTPIFERSIEDQSDTITTDKGTFKFRDLIRFRIQAVNTENPALSKFMTFRAYLSQLSDSTNANWNGTQYIGRADTFYIYNGFTRKMQIGFQVATLSKEEMEPLYQKLNYLMGNLMPDYGKGILLRGPLVRMSVGNWIDSQLGIIDSLTYTVSNDSPWEIALDEPEGGLESQVLTLPHVVDVSLSFTPIGSETEGTNKIPAKSLNTSHIAQNNTGYNKNTIKYIDGTYLHKDKGATNYITQDESQEQS